jgi:murein DD-endopeptidase MepM/ murein hydrolase activator NlpD
MRIRRLALVAVLVGAVVVGMALTPSVAPAARAASGSSMTAPTLRLQPPLRPLEVTRRFKPPPTPYAAGHRGVDLGSFPGAEVRAAGAGTISYAGPLAGRGVVVVVHGALRTTYEPVTAAVRRGASVAAGQRIGTLEPGHAGCPVAACLHWGLLRGDVYLDPLALLGPRAVRLLPLSGDPVRGQPAGAAPQGSAMAVRPVAANAPAGNGFSGPSTATWSLAALAGAGAVVASRRRR